MNTFCKMEFISAAPSNGLRIEKLLPHSLTNVLGRIIMENDKTIFIDK